MSNRLNNKIAIITGAARGIGAKSAELLQVKVQLSLSGISTPNAARQPRNKFEPLGELPFSASAI